MASEVHEHIARIVREHMHLGTLGTGHLVCKCTAQFPNDREFGIHLAEMIEVALSDEIVRHRAEAQMHFLAAAARYWGPAGKNARSRNVYTGTQFSGWLMEQARGLHRRHPRVSPPTQGAEQQ